MHSTGAGRESGDSLHVSLLGSFQVELAGCPLESFRTSKVQALFIYLLLQALEHPTGLVSRGQVMTLLWPEKSGKSARENLRQTLYHLRQTIPAGESLPFVLSDRQKIWVNPDTRYQLDVATFTTLVEEGGADELAAAVELYRDDFLVDFYLKDSSEFETWAAEWRSVLRRQVMDALDRLVEVHLDRGDAEIAATYARRQLEIDNLHESAHRGLMIALSRMGKRTEAIRQFESCHARLHTELGVAPSAETEAVLRAVRDGDSVPADRERRGRSRLPVPDTALIGRDAELSDIIALLRDRTRLVSIVGPGGSGKTRLALEVAHQLAARSGNRTAFVNLAPLSEQEDIEPAVARALELEFEQDDNEAIRRRLLEYLRNKQLLLVLDNFEHLLEKALLLTEILQAAPAVKLLVTSRECLNLRAEHVYPLSGLAYSQWTTPVEAARDPAVRLFLHHARRVRPAFTLRSEHLASLQDIVQLAEGMPLALILAAEWVKVLSPVEIAAELGKSLDFLEATHQDVPARQQSMRAVFDSTWLRLSEREQTLFAALSVFRGGFTRGAGRAVAGASSHDLLRLANRSLLHRLQGGRFEIHELLRQYAAERLARAGDAEMVRDAHSAYYMSALARRLPDLKGPNQLEALEAIASDFDNVRAAWRWASERHRWEQLARASQSLYLFALIRSRYLDGIDLFKMTDRAISAASDDHQIPGRAYVLAGRSALLSHAGLQREARALLPDLWRVVETDADPEAVAYCQLALGMPLAVDRRYAEAIEVHSRARAYYEGAQDPFYAALALHRLSRRIFWSGRPRDAIALLHHGLSLARQAGDLLSASLLLGTIGADMWMVDGPSERSERYYWEGAIVSRELGERVRYANSLAQVANMPLWREGDAVKPRPHLEEALAIAEEQNVTSVRLHILAEITTHRLVEGNYEEALILTEEILASEAVHMGTRCWASIQRGITLLALGNNEEALPFLKQGLSKMIELNWTAFLSTFLPFFGIIYAWHGELERAVELLARGFTQPHASGRLEIDPLITQFRAEMEDALGEERFAAAWERGEKLDALTVAVEVLETLDSRA